MIPQWNERPSEIANLFNPAFIGVLLRQSIDGYTKEAKAGMPFELIFLVPPICLHPATAKRLPRSPSATPLHAWLQREENRDVLIAFSERASTLVPFVREALLFSCGRGVISIGDDGKLTAGRTKLRGITQYRLKGEEVKDGIRHAELTGRWFALAGTTATVFTLFGVQP